MNVLTGAYNPFPDSSLTVISCKADDAAKLTIAGCDASGNITIAVASMWVLPRTPCSSPCKTAPSPRIVKSPHRLPCP